MDFWPRFKQLFSHHRADRYKVNLPVDLQHATGVTRDFSPTGVYFETDLTHQEGSLISFTIDFDTPTQGDKTQLECTGRIVRVELGDMGKVGIAVKFDKHRLRMVKQ